MSEADSAVADQIVTEACAGFLRAGYAQVSTEQIARSLGRSKKTLYRHFATKEALLQAVLARVEAEQRQAVEALIAGRAGDPSGRLCAILAVAAEHHARTQLVLLPDLAASAPVLAEQVRAWRRRALADVLEPVLREALTDGTLRGDLPVDGVLAVFCGCVEGLAATEASGDRFALLARLLVDGLMRR